MSVTDVWGGGNGDFGGGNWSPEQPDTSNDDAAVVVSAGSISIAVAAGEQVGAGSVLADATSTFVGFDIAGTLLLTDTANAFTDLTAGGVTVESGGTFDTGQFLMQSTASAGGNLVVAGSFASGISSVEYDEHGTFDLTATGSLSTGADLVIADATSVVFAGSATVGNAIDITGSGSTPTQVTISGAVSTGAAAASMASVTAETSLLTDVAVTLSGGSMTLGTGAANAKSALVIDAQSSLAVTGNASIADLGTVGGARGVDDQANTTIEAGATLSVATAFTIDNDDSLNLFTNNGVVAVSGARADLIVTGASGLTGSGTYVLSGGATFDVSAATGVMGFGAVSTILNGGTIVFAPGATSTTYAPVSLDVGATSAMLFDGAGAQGPLPDAALYLAATHSITFLSGNGLTTDIVQNVTLDGVSIDTSLSVSDFGVNAMVSFAIACFGAGTMIRTPDGETAVERLRVGDRVVVMLDGVMAERDIRWVGDTVVDIAHHARPERVAPIVVRAHAIADGVPARDLVVSPDHALVVAGLRIQARQLLNGRSITQDLSRASVRYFHVELSVHSAMIAEGLTAESYLDTGNRDTFASGAPEAEIEHDAPAFAPLAIDAASVQPVWRSIADRAGGGGVATTSEAELHLVVDDRAIRPSLIEGSRHLFVLPETDRVVRLASRAAMPCQARPWLDDRRRLGVAVRCIVEQSRDAMTVIGADHTGLVDGWHAAERSGGVAWRWTDGDAVIPVGPDARTIVVDLHATGDYPIAA